MPSGTGKITTGWVWRPLGPTVGWTWDKAPVIIWLPKAPIPTDGPHWHFVFSGISSRPVSNSPKTVWLFHFSQWHSCSGKGQKFFGGRQAVRLTIQNVDSMSGSFLKETWLPLLSGDSGNLRKSRSWWKGKTPSFLLLLLCKLDSYSFTLTFLPVQIK